jgi:hypothetical protein
LLRGRPGKNGHAERLIGTIWRECLDHVVIVIFGEDHLWRTLKAYAAYYTMFGHILLFPRMHRFFVPFSGWPTSL